MKSSEKKRLIWLLAFGLLILLTWRLSALITPQDLEALLSSLGSWAPLVYTLLWLFLPAFFFPVPILALAGGLLFGLFWGSIYTFLGAILNCSLMFLMARSFGRKQVRELVQRRLSPQWQKRLNSTGGTQGFLLLIVLRLIPAVPYNLINYGFGLTEMGFRPYCLASALGIIPGTLAFINIGDKALNIKSPSFCLAVALLLLLLLVTGALGKRFLSANENNDKESK